MLLTAPHALFQYHRLYDNVRYRTACTAIATALAPQNPAQAERLPAYLRLANLLTDTALELCGHPAYHGVGWTLAHTLYQATADNRQVFTAVEAYLAPFRQGVADWQATLDADPAASLSVLLDVAQVATDTAISTASLLPYWQGRAAYHLLGACAGYLQVTTLYLRHKDTLATIHDSYLAEKLRRALRDTHYSLDELAQHDALPLTLAQLRTTLRALQEE